MTQPVNYCHACEVNCDNGYSFGPCVLDRGPEVAYFGIRDWKQEDKVSLQENFYKVALGVESYIQRNKVPLQCLIPDAGMLESDPGPAVSYLLNRYCNLNTDDITISNVMSCLGSSSSVYSRMLGNRYITINISGTKTGGVINYNLADVVDNLPTNFMVANIKTDLYKDAPDSIYSSKISSHNKQTIGSFSIDGDQFPSYLDVNIDIGSPGGLLTLSRKIPITSFKNDSFNAILDIQDRTSAKGGAITQTAFNELIEAALCNIRNVVDSLKTVGVVGCADMKHASKDIRDVVSVHDGHICSLYGRLNNIGKEKITGMRCEDNCEEHTFSTTIQEWASAKDKMLCDHEKRITELETKIKELDQRIKVCCEMKSATQVALQGTGVNNTNSAGGSNNLSGSSSGNLTSGANAPVGGQTGNTGSSGNDGGSGNGGSDNGGSGGTNNGGNNGSTDTSGRTDGGLGTSSGTNGNPTDGSTSPNNPNGQGITIIPQNP